MVVNFNHWEFILKILFKLRVLIPCCFKLEFFWFKLLGNSFLLKLTHLYLESKAWGWNCIPMYACIIIIIYSIGTLQITSADQQIYIAYIVYSHLKTRQLSAGWNEGQFLTAPCSYHSPPVLVEVLHQELLGARCLPDLHDLEQCFV